MLQFLRVRQLSFYTPNLRFVTTVEIQPNHPLSSLLDLCTYTKQLQQIHARFVLRGLHQNPHLSSKLIDTYANLGQLYLSQQLFDSIVDPNSMLYDAYIRNLYKFGEYKKTLLAFQEMVMKSMHPDEGTFFFVLKSCSELSDAQNAKRIHGHVIKVGFDSYGLVVSTLDEMYKAFGNFEYANEQPLRGLIYWNSLIFEAYQDGDPDKSFNIFQRMRIERVEPDLVTVVNLLKASVDLESLKFGRHVHCLAVVFNLCKNLAVNTALLAMYSNLGSLEYAKLLFDKIPEKDCVVWNLMISAYSSNGRSIESLKLLTQMVRSAIRPDLFTAIAIILSIADLRSLQKGKQVHAHVIRNGSDYQVSVQNALINMYNKSNCLIAARKIFDAVTDKTLVSWSSMIKGYVSHEHFHDAWSLFTNMQLNGIRVDSITVINILPACVNLGALEQVKSLHGYSIKEGLNVTLSVNTTFLISYAKCGCIEIAQKLFNEEQTDNKDVIIWNTMISAYSKHGVWFKCFELYNQMKQSNLKPDQVTYLGLLTACVNSGSVREGWEYLNEMTEKYGYQPNQEHYACMVDLLGRAGQMKEASELINSMPFEPDARIWGPFLSACKMHKEPKLAEFAAERLITMEPKNAGNYVLLSNIYAAAGKWDGVAKMRIFLRDRGLRKTPGCSWLEINGKVHQFRVADQSHLQSSEIYTILGNLEWETKELSPQF